MIKPFTLILFNSTSNTARLTQIEMYIAFMQGEIPNFIILGVDRWNATEGAYRADICADIRDQCSDSHLVEFAKNLFYLGAFDILNPESYESLKKLDLQLEQERGISHKIIDLSSVSSDELLEKAICQLQTVGLIATPETKVLTKPFFRRI